MKSVEIIQEFFKIYKIFQQISEILKFWRECKIFQNCALLASIIKISPKIKTIKVDNKFDLILQRKIF